ncbi:uncharacterized protein METZ01_LOCUS421975, partial [marine metagenome]
SIDGNTNLQLIIQNSSRSDTAFIIQDEIINLPQGHYRLILNSFGYIPQIFDINLIENRELSANLLYEHIIWEENPLGIWNFASDTEALLIPLSNITSGTSLIIEMHFNYELEWGYDYFIIDYINVGDTTEIMKFTGDNYKYYVEYIPFVIPEGHFDGTLYLHLDKDDTWKNKYRGVEVDYIKVIKGSEIPLANAPGVLEVLPDKFHLYQNYPNPFNPSTSINFSVPSMALVSISIYNIRGEFIEQLVNDIYQPGNYSVNLHAAEYASGIYL